MKKEKILNESFKDLKARSVEVKDFIFQTLIVYKFTRPTRNWGQTFNFQNDKGI